MKSFYYFFYGFISALFAFVVFFDNCGYQLLDDYYIKLLNKECSEIWFYTKLTIVFLFIICCITWIYQQGISAATEMAKQYEEEEKLLNDKIEENE